MKLLPHLTSIILLIVSHQIEAYDFSGNVSFESKLFNHKPIQTTQTYHDVSISINPEFYTSWENDNTSLTIEPFFRWDHADKERTHFDFREFIFYKNMSSWELKAGLGKVFWGVTESQHLVDIINQTDAIEGIEGEEKLGQPMISLSMEKNWGAIDLFVLPYFRKRTFTGINGRLRPQIKINNDNEIYESNDEEKHVDYAIRYSHTIDDWDFGISHFYGTNREPEFIAGLDTNGAPILTPIYYLLRQSGVDIQLVKDDWLWKLEAVHKKSNQRSYNALTFGFEYTYVGILDSNLDIGLIAEYLRDSRDNLATTPFQRDLMIGARLNFNDTQSSEILIGTIVDIDNQERILSLEASTRLSDNWKINIDGRIFSNSKATSLLYNFRNDDYVQIELQYYY